MKSPGINLIVAVGKNNEIGKQGRLIWRISDDLKRFKKITMGGVLIMGRKTYQSIGRPLPGRINIVITRQKDFPHKGIFIARSPEEALEKARCFGKEIFIIGGEQIYRALLPHARRLFLTRIEAQAPGADAFFPDISEEQWKITSRSNLLFDQTSQVSFRFIEYIAPEYNRK